MIYKLFGWQRCVARYIYLIPIWNKGNIFSFCLPISTEVQTIYAPSLLVSYETINQGRIISPAKIITDLYIFWRPGGHNSKQTLVNVLFWHGLRCQECEIMKIFVRWKPLRTARFICEPEKHSDGWPKKCREILSMTANPARKRKDLEKSKSHPKLCILLSPYSEYIMRRCLQLLSIRKRRKNVLWSAFMYVFHLQILRKCLPE